MNKPEPNHYAAYYTPYITLVGDDPLDQLRAQAKWVESTLTTISDTQANQAYAEGKWSFKSLLMHISDSERVFAYRALSIARGDTHNFPGFDEDRWAEVNDLTHRHWEEILAEYFIVRQSTLALLLSFGETELNRVGTANDYTVSVRALVFMLAGHEAHHIQVLKERYLPHLR